MFCLHSCSVTSAHTSLSMGVHTYKRTNKEQCKGLDIWARTDVNLILDSFTVLLGLLAALLHWLHCALLHLLHSAHLEGGDDWSVGDVIMLLVMQHLSVKCSERRAPPQFPPRSSPSGPADTLTG